MIPVINYVGDNSLTLCNSINDITLEKGAFIMSIDASSSITGISIINLVSEKPVYTIALKAEDKESYVTYKVRFKAFLLELLKSNRSIDFVAYEEPFFQFVEAAEVLFALRTSVPELIVEQAPLLDYIEYSEENNKTWKKLFLCVDALPNDSKMEKKLVSDKIIQMFPQFEKLTQDEKDAAAIGIIKARELKGKVIVKRKQKSHRFDFEAEFIGTKDVNVAWQGFLESSRIPEILKSREALLYKHKRNDNFEECVYEKMGSDDRIVIVELETKISGNIILKYRLGSINDCEKIYGAIWRKNRKK